MATTTAKDPKNTKQILQGLRIHIASSVAIPEREELGRKIKEHGGQLKDLDHIEDATHIITEGLHFEGREDVTRTAKVVTPIWLRHSLTGKLQLPAYYSPDPSKIFSGCIVAIDGLLAADAEAISAVVTSKGGQHRQSVTLDTTHLICAAAHGKTYQLGMQNRARTGMKIVVPHWFDDSYKTDHLMPTKMYEYPNPPLFDPKRQSALGTSEQQGVRSFDKDPKTMIRTVARAEKDTGSPVKSTRLAQEPPQCNIWEDKTILLSRDLEFAEGRRDAFAAEIRRTGGKVRELAKGEDEVAAVSDADIIIMKFREGRVYLRALEQRKTIGSLAWLLYVEYAQRYSSPFDHILHYPIRSTGIPELVGKTLTATNYSGEVRDYIKKLIIAVGGTFTPVMTSRTDYLIASEIKGEKANRAKEWSIPTVNHLWLEDAFKAWRTPAVTETKYVRWQAAVPYTEVISFVPFGPLDIMQEIERVKAQLPDEEERIEISDDEEDTPSPTSGTNGVSLSAEQVEKLVAVDEPINIDDNVVWAGDGGDALPPPPLASSSSMKKPRIIQDYERKTMPPPPLPPKAKAQSPAPSQASSSSGPRRTLAPVIDRSPSLRRAGSIGSQSQSQSQSQSSQSSQTSTSRPTIPAPAVPQSLVSPRVATSTPPRPAGRPSTPDYMKLPSPFPEEPSPTKRISDKRKAMVPPSTSVMNASASIFPSSARAGGMSTPKKPRPVPQSSDVDVDSDEEDAVTPKASTHTTTWPKAVSKAGSSSQLRRGDAMDVDEDDRGSSQGLKRIKSSVSLKKSASSSTMRASSPTPSTSKLHRTKSSQRMDQPSSDLSSAPSTEDEDDPKPVPKAPRKTVKRERSTSSETETKRALKPEPTIFGKRSAAKKAEQKLKTDMQDANNYAIEMSKGKVRGTWEDDGSSGTAEEAKVKGTNKKRSRSQVDDAGPSTSKKRLKSDDRDVGPSVERVRGGSKASATPPATGIKFITTRVDLSDADTKTLLQLGMKQTNDPSVCTHIVVKRLIRTEKFVLALCNGPIVATEQWLRDCIKHETVLPASDYPLVDREGEARWNFSFADALQRAQSGRGAGRTLFQGHTFYLTPSLQVQSDFLKMVISHAGGTCKSGVPALRILQQPESVEHHHVVSGPKDGQYWMPLVDQGIPVYTKEVVMTPLMTQALPKWGVDHLITADES